LIVEKLLAWYVFFSIGIDNLYNFVMHVFFGEMSARFIGWADSPFQLEVGTASLGFAVVGLLAAFRSFDLRLAAIIGPSIFTLGAAVGHVYQMGDSAQFRAGQRWDYFLDRHRYSAVRLLVVVARPSGQALAHVAPIAGH
jgi:hypothetical protein